MRIIEHGAHRVSVDLEALFTWEDTRHALAFMDSLEYKNSMKLLVLAERSRSQLSEAEALEFGKSMGHIASQGDGRIAVVHAKEPRPDDMAYLLIDTSISLRHRLIAQFVDIHDAKVWLDW